MRIAYFTESLYPHVDGVSRTLARLFTTLEKRGIDFVVFSPFVPGPEVAWAHRVREVRSFRFPPYPDYRVSLPFQRRVTRELQRFSPDLIHVSSPTPMGYWAQSLAHDLRRPAVGSFHTHFVSYFRYYGVGRLEGFGWSALRRFYRDCQRVYAPSRSIVRELERHGIGGVELWSRGIDLGGFSPDHADPDLARAAGAGEGRPLLLMVSRLVKEKDLLDLVAVNRILRERGVDFAFALVGDGPLRSELERALPDAYFAGHQSGRDLARWYASADVFVFPSTTETLGNVVLEALASGLPAVVVDRGGPQDLIRPGETGYVVKSNDPSAMAEKLRRLLEDPGLRAEMAAQARGSASSREWDEINGGLIDSYEEVLREWPAGRGVEQ